MNRVLVLSMGSQFQVIKSHILLKVHCEILHITMTRPEIKPSTSSLSNKSTKYSFTEVGN